MRRFYAVFALAAGFAMTAACTLAQNPGQRLELDRKGETIVLEPYAPDILRVTLSLQQENALAAPGYGVVATPDAAGWSASQTGKADVYSSAQMSVTVDNDQPETHRRCTRCSTSRSTSTAPLRTRTSRLHARGTRLLEMTGWSQSVPNNKDDTAGVADDRRPTDPPFYIVGATFTSPNDEHYYGLGQNHEGFLDHRGHPVRCWADYTAPAAPSWCVPFLVTNKGYAVLWDNPSETTISPGFNEQTRWVSKEGDRVSFFVIAGATTDDFYAGYKLLTGPTHVLPKAAYGYIQCKQRYASQDELMSVAKGYRDRHLPADVLVVDWFYYTQMGQMDYRSKVLA